MRVTSVSAVLLLLSMLIISFVVVSPLVHVEAQTTYTVQSGDTLYSIGVRFGIPWQSIATANNIPSPYIIYVGQVLVIPISSSSSTTCTVSTSTIYTVQPGDYLYLIGQKFGVPWQSIAQANNIQSPYYISTGQKLIIPLVVPCSQTSTSKTTTSQTTTSKTTTSTTTSRTSSSTSTFTTTANIQYTVQPGDYLYLIGQKFGVSWQSIAQVNNIPSPYIIYVGEVLLIPVTTTTTTTTTTRSSTSTSTSTSATCALITYANPIPLSEYVPGATEAIQDETTTTSLSENTVSSSSDLTTTTTTSSSSSLSSSSSATTSTSSTSTRPPKYVMLRFDDTFQDQWVYALPLLQQYGFNAVFAVGTGAVVNGSAPKLVDGWQNLNWQEVQWLYANGFEIADHSTNHEHLNSLSCADLNYQIAFSRYSLAQHGITNVPGFALPYGEGLYNATVMSLIFQDGFKHVYPDDSVSFALTNYTQIRTQWYAIDQLDGQSLQRFQTLAGQASSTFAVGFIYHHIDDHATNTLYYVNTTNFQQEMAYLNANGYTVIAPMNLPGY